MWEIDEVRGECVFFDMDMGCVKNPNASHLWEWQGLLSIRLKGMSRPSPCLSTNVERVHRNDQSQFPPPV